MVCEGAKVKAEAGNAILHGVPFFSARLSGGTDIRARSHPCRTPNPQWT
jgi:hypothetical protein